MKTKSIIIIASLLFLGLVFWYFKDVSGWMELRKNTDTPKEFLNHVVIKKEIYDMDSDEISQQLKKQIKNHEEFFYSKEFFDSTQVLIDSIIYSPNFNKLAVLVISKNPTSRQLMPDKRYKWYYNASFYLGVRQNDTIYLSWIGPSYTNSYNKEKISEEIRETAFRTFATKDTNGSYAFKYNLNDVRFWNNSIGGELEIH